MDRVQWCFTASSNSFLPYMVLLMRPAHSSLHQSSSTGAYCNMNESVVPFG